MNPPSPEPSWSRRLHERVAASRFLTFSLLIHAIIVLLGGGVVLMRHQNVAAPDFPIGSLSPELEEEAIRPDDPLTDPTLHFMPAPATPQVTVNVTQQVIHTMSERANIAVLPQTRTTPPLTVPKFAAGPVLMPAEMKGRGADGREAGMNRMGGRQEADKAVVAGLRWLKKVQNADGSWSDGDANSKAAMTGLALLCFLGHGELPESAEFGPTAKKAVDWLLEQGTTHDGKFVPSINQPGCYAHAMAAYALAEYFTMSKDERVREVVTRSIAHIVEGQAPDGGWQYGYQKGPNSDTSVSGWQIQALKAAHLTGLAIPGVDEALDKAMPNLARVQSPDGNFGYRRAGDRGDNPSLAGVGVLCTMFWKQEIDASYRKGIDFLLEATEKKYPIKYRHEQASLYSWYYATQACLMWGGRAWTKWNRMFQDELIHAQSPDGSWPPTGHKSGGHGENDPGLKGAIYRTTLCVLMLEVFYRYLPVTKG